MIHQRLRYFLCLFFSLVSVLQTKATVVTTDSIPHQDITIAYSIAVNHTGKAGIGETYNGGVKTVFAGAKGVRIRQASLARIQSIFLLPQKNGVTKVAIVKESGAEKYRVNMTSGQWAAYNKKYDSARFVAYDDSLVIGGYNCRRGVVSLTDGEEIEVFYTTELQNKTFQQADPAFTAVAGIVLQYTYRVKKNSIVYTATEIVIKPIDKKVFTIPTTGYQLKRYIPGKPPEPVSDLLQEEEEDDNLPLTDSLQKQ